VVWAGGHFGCPSPSWGSRRLSYFRLKGVRSVWAPPGMCAVTSLRSLALDCPPLDDGTTKLFVPSLRRLDSETGLPSDVSMLTSARELQVTKHLH